MEALDLQIVQCLLRDGRAPSRRIAEALGVSEQTVARRYRGLIAEGALRVQVQPDERVTGQQRWFVRVQCRPDAAAALADSMAAHGDVSWVSITSGGSEIVCVAFSDPSLEDGSLLARLPRTRQVLSFTAFAVLHLHVNSSETKWMPFDEPLTPAQIAALRGVTGLASAAAHRHLPRPRGALRLRHHQGRPAAGRPPGRGRPRPAPAQASGNPSSGRAVRHLTRSRLPAPEAQLRHRPFPARPPRTRPQDRARSRT